MGLIILALAEEQSRLCLPEKQTSGFSIAPGLAGGATEM